MSIHTAEIEVVYYADRIEPRFEATEDYVKTTSLRKIP
jgi:hypothetical protein